MSRKASGESREEGRKRGMRRTVGILGDKTRRINRFDRDLRRGGFRGFDHRLLEKGLLSCSCSGPSFTHNPAPI